MNQADVDKVISHFQALAGKRDLLRQQLSNAQKEEIRLSHRYDKAGKARIIIQHAAQITQQNLEYHISHLISLALAAVWSDPYTLKINFVKKRNHTECEIKLVRGEEELDPIFATGGGVCDVVSFALQISFLTMTKNKRKVFITDEPLSYLHNPILQKNASEMVKTFCDLTQTQVIMISDQPEIYDCADRVFKITINKGISNVEVLR